jgi:hypothetical protein
LQFAIEIKTLGNLLIFLAEFRICPVNGGRQDQEQENPKQTM